MKAADDPQLWTDWQWHVRNMLDMEALKRCVPAFISTECFDVDAAFPVRLTPYYLDLLAAENWSGPLSKMALPDASELESGGFTSDPFDEEGASACCYGCKQRFPDRVLMMVSGVCAMNCRHCTRKGLLHQAEIASSAAHIKSAVEFVVSKPLIREVLLSGGDPLMLHDEQIVGLVAAFAGLPQVDAIRIGTRIPVTLPFRITPRLARSLGSFQKVWVNTQFNHRSEITPEAETACRLLVEAGIPVSNQSVLLRGVNDSPDAMFDLCSALQRIRVRPYYVFLCDPVAGVNHFRVSKERAVQIENAIAVRLGGLSLPRFVEDIPGNDRKLPI